MVRTRGFTPPGGHHAQAAAAHPSGVRALCPPRPPGHGARRPRDRRSRHGTRRLGASRGRSANIPACPAGPLVAWIDTNGNGAAGTIFFKLKFTNLSGHRCSVRGYPGVSAANPSGHAIGPGAGRSGTPVRTIRLSNGATATANLGIVAAGNFSPRFCRPATAAGLRVFAPGATLAKFVPFPFAACRRHANLRISPAAPH